MGHYLAARRCGVKIDAFSIGFGPELFGWYDKRGTRWRVSALPLGGYVKMFGDADVTSRPPSNLSEDQKDNEDNTGNWAGGIERPLSPEESDVSFHHMSLSERTLIVAVGVLANLLMDAVLVSGIFALVGLTTTPPKIGRVMEDSSAKAAEMRAGDRML